MADKTLNKSSETKNYQFKEPVIPYGPSNLHPAIDKGAFEVSNDTHVPSVKSFSHNPDDIVGYVDLVYSDDGGISFLVRLRHERGKK